MKNRPPIDPHVRALVTDLDKLICRYAAEYDFSLATVIGALECVKIELYIQETTDFEEDE